MRSGDKSEVWELKRRVTDLKALIKAKDKELRRQVSKSIVNENELRNQLTDFETKHKQMQKKIQERDWTMQELRVSACITHPETSQRQAGPDPPAQRKGQTPVQSKCTDRTHSETRGRASWNWLWSPRKAKSCPDQKI